MNNKNINEEIEILDGLDEFFAPNNTDNMQIKNNQKNESKTEEVKDEKIEIKDEQPIFSFDEELFKPSEEEVLNVLEEPVVDMEKIKEEKTVEVPFSTFVPDSINMEVKENESLMKNDLKVEKEEPVVNQIPSMDEIFYMDFDKFEQHEEKNEPKPEVKKDDIVEIKDNSIEPFDSEESIAEQVTEIPSFDQEEDLEKTDFYLDEILKPVSLEEPKEETNVAPKEEVKNEEIKIESNIDKDEDPFSIDTSLFDNVNLEPVEPVYNEELEKTNFDINYTLSDQNTNNELDNTIDSAFTFDVEDNLNQSTELNNDALGETVIIEPVDLKPVEKTEEVAKVENVQNISNTENNNDLKSNEENVVEENKVVENTGVVNKKDGRFFVLILLIVMLLLSFVILLPTIIEKFAI